LTTFLDPIPDSHNRSSDKHLFKKNRCIISAKTNQLTTLQPSH